MVGSAAYQTCHTMCWVLGTAAEERQGILYCLPSVYSEGFRLREPGASSGFTTM